MSKDFASTYKQISWKHAVREFEANKESIARYRELLANAKYPASVNFLENIIAGYQERQEKLRKKFPKHLT